MEVLKKGSKGESVRTLQEFLKITLKHLHRLGKPIVT